MDKQEEFQEQRKKIIQQIINDDDLRKLSIKWLEILTRRRYSYNFDWLGRPIIQLPQDIIAIQEIIWNVKPDLIIETGVAHGGGLILYASILELISGPGHVLGIDIEIRPHNRKAIEEHPLSKRISLIEGSSVDPEVVRKVYKFSENKNKVMVILDSLHTHDHVLKELELYSPLVKKGSYIVVFDTSIEDLPDDLWSDRPWKKGNNPKTAVYEFLKTNDRFVIDKEIQSKILITAALDGYLKCVKD